VDENVCLSNPWTGFLIEKRLKDLDIIRPSSLLTRKMLLALDEALVPVHPKDVPGSTERIG
jgi:hypothetical protein